MCTKNEKNEAGDEASKHHRGIMGEGVGNGASSEGDGRSSLTPLDDHYQNPPTTIQPSDEIVGMEVDSFSMVFFPRWA